MATSEHLEDPHLLHLFDGGDSMNVYSSKVQNLSAGAPGPDLLSKCIDIFNEATQHRMEIERKHAYLFQYGITSGLWEFRQELASFLSMHYGDPVHRADLVLTCGATHGLQLAMGAFLDPRAIIFVEEVTYMIALDAFKEYPLMKIVSVPMTSKGVNTDALECIATSEKAKWTVTAQKTFWAMFYTVPFCHNPTGCTMSIDCCQQVVEVARKLDLLVVCDDVYNFLYYGDEPKPPQRLFAYDTPRLNQGHVISNGTFSKILAPGIRVGWLEMPPGLALILRNSGILRSGGATNQYMSGIVTSLLQLGSVKQHLVFLVETFKARMESLCEVLQQNLPSGCSFLKPIGGYFVWIELPKLINGNDFAEWCKEEYKVSALPGSRFALHGTHANCLRLSIAFHQQPSLEQAGKSICLALHKYLKLKQSF